ncbi:MAG: septum formation initiator family protein [Candidatus Omnitrophica bacterium]|nr:septum formation initiator family protein [Candidatus Omnitrophota bacterium]MCA9405461.1 septum formation initiator family protein [Candidatus Omnitrophota bacterium]
MLKNGIILFIIALLIFVFFLPSFTRMQDLKEKNREYAAKILELELKNTQLEEERRLLEEDPVYLEKIAREKMGIAREGEVIYKLLPASVMEEKTEE